MGLPSWLFSTLYLHAGFPPSSTDTACSLIPSSGGGLDVSLQWSSYFNSLHAVERYNVAVTPDPSSCSSDQVPPSEDYSCSGLDLGTNYSITVSAINCGDQEGERASFNTQLQSQLLGIIVCYSDCMRYAIILCLVPGVPEDVSTMISDSNHIDIQWTEVVSLLPIMLI